MDNKRRQIILGAVGASVIPTRGAACGDRTRRQTAGPFFRPDSPLRTRIVDDKTPGISMLLQGRVLDANCEPLAGTSLDFWQADERGTYDNRGYPLRGHQFSDEAGNYHLETIKPGSYGDQRFRRTPHIHVRLITPTRQLLTTQLYFPDEHDLNQSDVLFEPSLLVELKTGDEPTTAYFDFILAVE